MTFQTGTFASSTEQHTLSSQNELSLDRQAETPKQPNPTQPITMLGKHTSTVLALGAFVAVGVFMPGMDNTTRRLSIEESVSTKQ